VLRIALILITLSLLLSGCADFSNVKPSPENARRALKLRGIEYSEGSFLEYAAAGDEWAVNAFLAAGMNPNVRDDREETPLITAAARGDLAVVKALLNGNADINATDRDKRTALMRAIINGREAMAKALLARNPELNVQEKYSQSALMIASWRLPQLVPVMIDKGASVNLRDADGETALFQASAAGHVDAVRELIRRGADITVRNSVDATALMFAAARGRAEVVRELLSAGADVAAKDYKGRTARDWSEQGGHTAVADLLREAEQKAGKSSSER
jgi:ankyrin repeat protein